MLFDMCIIAKMQRVEMKIYLLELKNVKLVQTAVYYRCAMGMLLFIFSSFIPSSLEQELDEWDANQILWFF